MNDTELVDAVLERLGHTVEGLLQCEDLTPEGAEQVREYRVLLAGVATGVYFFLRQERELQRLHRAEEPSP